MQLLHQELPKPADFEPAQRSKDPFSAAERDRARNWGTDELARNVMPGFMARSGAERQLAHEAAEVAARDAAKRDAVRRRRESSTVLAAERPRSETALGAAEGQIHARNDPLLKRHNEKGTSVEEALEQQAAEAEALEDDGLYIAGVVLRAPRVTVHKRDWSNTYALATIEPSHGHQNHHRITTLQADGLSVPAHQACLHPGSQCTDRRRRPLRTDISGVAEYVCTFLTSHPSPNMAGATLTRIDEASPHPRLLGSWQERANERRGQI
jgi:hypothetical protein